jgi:multiple sugar transport system permease protein/cellobiose transport system permease protein
MVMGLMFVKFTESVVPIVLKSFGQDIPNLFLDERYNLGIIIFYIMWTGFTSSLIMYPNAMSAISGEIIESAELDGVSELQELWYIVMPLIYPTITTYMVTGVAAIFSSQGPLFIIYNYDAPGNVYNTGYYLFKKVMAGDGLRDYPNAAAAGLIFTFISAPLTLGVRTIMEKFGPQAED